jgi:fatty-acyl-CoA synthase
MGQLSGHGNPEAGRTGMIPDLAAQRASLTPDRPAIWWDGRWFTYGELNARAERLAARLHASGVRKRDRVSILALNHLVHFDLILATAKLGFIYTPLNYRLGEAELQQLVDYARPALLLHDDVHAEAAGKLDVGRVSLTDYDGWLGDAPAAPKPALAPGDSQMMLFTGGTTGLPKGALLPYRQGFQNAVNTVLSWGLQPDDCVIQATPCFHAAVNALALPLLHLGARVVLVPSFQPAGYLQLLESSAATLMFLVPTMYAMLQAEPAFASTDLRSVRWAISGGAPCPAPIREGFRQRGVHFRQGYGLTEAGVNCFSIEQEMADLHPDSVGKPILHSEAGIRRPDGQPADVDEVGELMLRGQHLFSGYFDRPAETSAVLKDGWLATGDLARRDAQGLYYIVGRRKEMFISGGENIYPVEIENALYTHPGVSECAVLSVPDEHWGETGLAVVVPASPAPAADELLEHLRARLARFKVPRHLRFVSALPRSGAGKIVKLQLRERFTGGWPAEPEEEGSRDA